MAHIIIATWITGHRGNMVRCLWYGEGKNARESLGICAKTKRFYVQFRMLDNDNGYETAEGKDGAYLTEAGLRASEFTVIPNPNEILKWVYLETTTTDKGVVYHVYTPK